MNETLHFLSPECPISECGRPVERRPILHLSSGVLTADVLYLILNDVGFFFKDDPTLAAE